MKNFLVSTTFLLVISISAFSQNNFCGRVVTNNSGKEEPLEFATIRLIGYENIAMPTNANGEFCFEKILNKNCQIEVACLGFNKKTISIQLPINGVLKIQLEQGTYEANEVIISATRASEKDAATYQIINKKELEQLNIGQDLPYIFQYAPSVVNTSDAGAGVGYTSLRIRGTDGTRINTTVNGIPVNDAESQGTFFVNFPDLASSAQSIQIQRGVGTSSNGSGAFGASINIQTLAMRDSAYSESNNTFGSFNTLKNSILFGTGLLSNHFTVNGRLSRIVSDGFIDRANSNLRSLYLDASYYGKKMSLHYVNFSGTEKTFQAWNGIPESKYNSQHTTQNSDTNLTNHFYNNLGYLYHTPQDSVNLFSSNNRTYNYFTYPNQTDNYSQYNHQLHFTYNLSNNLFFNSTVHYTKGAGYFEEYKINSLLSDYGIKPLIINFDTISSTTLIRQKWLDNNFYGTSYALNYKTGRWQMILGGASNQYTGKHFTKIVWAEYAATTDNQMQYNYNSSLKNDNAFYFKNIFSIQESFTIYTDIQMRNINYVFDGFDLFQKPSRQNVNYNFFNPKVGLYKIIDKVSSIYASFSIANREPTREDFIASTPSSRPQSEQLQDLEIGYKFNNSILIFEATAFYMNYKNQLVLTGKVNDVGAYTRINTPKSNRTGIEVITDYKLNAKTKLFGNATLSMNKIKNFDEYIYGYFSNSDSIAVYKTTFENTDIAFSPKLIATCGFQIQLYKNIALFYAHKFVDSQFLDNTSNKSKMLPAYNTGDVKIMFSSEPKWSKKLNVMLVVNNIFNKMYASNGYTYSSKFNGALIKENFVYPQAGMNIMLCLNIGL
jgi:iron complex outermembrane receptor protein